MPGQHQVAAGGQFRQRLGFAAGADFGRAAKPAHQLGTTAISRRDRLLRFAFIGPVGASQPDMQVGSVAEPGADPV
jgi:hypothetical protein